MKPEDWERLSITGYIPTDASRVQVLFGTYMAAGTAWFDCAQLEKSEAPSNYNLIENSFFENGSTAWSGIFNTGEGVQNASSYSGSARPAVIQKAVVLKGSYGQNRAISQTIPVNLPAEDVAPYFGGYAWAQSVPMTEYNRIFCLDLRFNYSDGTSQYVIPRFNPSTEVWQYTSKLILPSQANMSKHVTSVTVFCLYYYNANTAAFSGLDLHLDKTGAVYGYDSKGLLQSESFGGSVVSYSYNASDLVSAISSTRYAQDGQTQQVQNTYSYQKGYLSQITHNGFAYNFSYDGFGNPYQTRVGSQLLMTNTYATNNGPLTQALYGNGAVIDYVYDRYERMTQKKLCGTLKFEWAYDAKGNIASHSDLVNNKTYTYDMLGRLLKTDISDGNQAVYTYDNLDRTTGRQYTYNGTTRSYSYGFLQRRNGKIRKTCREGPRSLGPSTGMPR